MKANVKIILLMGLLFSFSIPANAQNESEEIKLPSERYALLFQIGENFNLSSFDGSVISFKYHFENSNALRIGVSISSTYQDVNANQIQDAKTFENNSFSGRINSGYIFYNNFEDGVTFYYGAGPFLGYQLLENSIINSDNTSSSVEDTIWEVGLDFVAGIEWFINKKFSLCAEYNISGFYSNSVSETQNTSVIVEEKEINNYRIIGKGVKVGLTVYL